MSVPVLSPDRIAGLCPAVRASAVPEHADTAAGTVLAHPVPRPAGAATAAAEAGPLDAVLASAVTRALLP